jgi:antitoxin (DNA-binding transcriptional repressor) of toxin-antitoxin stability system
MSDALPRLTLAQLAAEPERHLAALERGDRLAIVHEGRTVAELAPSAPRHILDRLNDAGVLVPM